MKRNEFFALTLAIVGVTSASAATIGSPVIFASGASLGTGVTGPDSIAVGNGSVWVAYTNGSDSTGANGSSLVVQYDTSGAVQHKYTLAGYVDGLKIAPSGLVWALQNQDGNPSLTLIDPSSNSTESLTYASTSSTRGFDDVVFSGGNIYMSYTNPAEPGDPTILQLLSASTPVTFNAAPILTFGTSGTLQNDPDSLKLGTNGDLVLTSGDDGALNFVGKAGQAGQTVRSIALNDAAGDSFAGLDDSLSPTNDQGTLYITDTGNNRVLSVVASGLDDNALYAAVGGTINAVGQVDPLTGLFTPVPTLTGLKAPHGLAFSSTPEPASLLLALGGLAIMLGVRRTRKD